jgi:hypothetical protein
MTKKHVASLFALLDGPRCLQYTLHVMLRRVQSPGWRNNGYLIIYLTVGNGSIRSRGATSRQSIFR